MGVALTVAAVATRGQRVPTGRRVAAVPAPQADSADVPCRCSDALPPRSATTRARSWPTRRPSAAAAWRPRARREPVVLRCGLDRPADFVVGVPIQVVDRVQWFEVSQDQR